MTEPQPPEHRDVAAAAERQRCVEALADEYLERLQAGEAPDRQALLAAHPDLADLLEPRLALVYLIHHAAHPPRRADGENGDMPRPSAPAGRAFHVKCPHCGNGIQLVEPDVVEVTCGGCGSSFRVEPGATTSYRPADLPRAVGKFEVLERLGRGAFGTVFKARDPELERLVAVKVPRAGAFATAEEEERFLREARAAAGLSHPGIVPVLEVARDGGLPYIVSAYVEGLTLADLLTGRRPTFREAAELVAATADALDHAHRQQVVHRDLKPANILLDAAGRPHVTDFGLARRGEGEITVTLDGQILGTLAYMSPEQATGDHRRVDARSDVYSLGVILYEMLTGELPFRGNQRMLLHQVIHDEPRPPRSLNDSIPRDLETICLKAMAKVPGRRYAGARELADDLRRFLNGEPIHARPVGRTEKLARWARRNPSVAGLLTAVGLLLVAVSAGAVGFAVYQQRAKHDLSDAKDAAERSQREAELRAASLAVDIDLKYCANDVEREYGILRLARTLKSLPPHATELRQCVEMNLLAWGQELIPLVPYHRSPGEHSSESGLSPDGLTFVTDGADGSVRFWDTFTGELRAALQGHRGAIERIQFSSDGRTVFTTGRDRTVRLWDARNARAGAVMAHSAKVEWALLSPDGHRLLTISDPDRLTLWDAVTGARVAELVGHRGKVHDAAFSPDGTRALTGGQDGTARLWSAVDGRPLGTLDGHLGGVQGVAIGPDGGLAATLDGGEGKGEGYVRGYVRWWDVQRLTQLEPACRSLHAPYGRGLLFIHRDVVVMREADGANGRNVFFIKGKDRGITCIAWGPYQCRADGRCLLDGRGKVYDLGTGGGRPPPAGRKFDPAVGRFAAESRFIALETGIIDLATEKAVGRVFARYVAARRAFVGHVDLASTVRNPRGVVIVPVVTKSVNPEVAQRFAEVITCQELDEATWDRRRQRLAELPPDGDQTHLFSKAAVDRWYWLKYHADLAINEGKWEEAIERLDRLIGADPSRLKFAERGHINVLAQHWEAAARDCLEAGTQGGGGFWHQPTHYFLPIVNALVRSEESTPEGHQLGLRLAEALSHARSEDFDRRVLLAIANYGVGRYAEALSLLETAQREVQLSIVPRVGQLFLRPFPTIPKKQVVQLDVIEAWAFLAMTHHRLGHPAQARASLEGLREMGNYYRSDDRPWNVSNDFIDLLREAESLIEGGPRPGK